MRIGRRIISVFSRSLGGSSERGKHDRNSSRKGGVDYRIGGWRRGWSGMMERGSMDWWRIVCEGALGIIYFLLLVLLFCDSILLKGFSSSLNLSRTSRESSHPSLSYVSQLAESLSDETKQTNRFQSITKRNESKNPSRSPSMTPHQTAFFSSQNRCFPSAVTNPNSIKKYIIFLLTASRNQTLQTP